MQKQLLKVIVIDDDGLGVRQEVFKKYFLSQAERQNKQLQLTTYTTFPSISELAPADIISWDNDLGAGGETVRHLKQLQWAQNQIVTLLLLKDKVHIVHDIFTKDLEATSYRIPFNTMKQLV